MTKSSKDIISLTDEYGAKNYAPLPVVISRFWDLDDRS